MSVDATDSQTFADMRGGQAVEYHTRTRTWPGISRMTSHSDVNWHHNTSTLTLQRKDSNLHDLVNSQASCQLNDIGMWSVGG